MEKCEKNLCETVEKLGKMGETAKKEQEYTEALHGVIISLTVVYSWCNACHSDNI
jgi:hypothetical protein